MADYAPLLLTEIVPAAHGEFEVDIDGDRIFSRLATNRFPDYEELRPELERRLGPPPRWSS